MTLASFALVAALLQQPAAPPTPPAVTLPASPIARMVITPARPSLLKNDSLRLTAQPLDSAGRPVTNAIIRFFGRTYAEGRVDSSGLITSANTGTIPIRIVATVPGTKPFIQTIEVPMLPGPAARVAVTPAVTRLVVGQHLRYSAESWSAIGDPR